MRKTLLKFVRGKEERGREGREKPWAVMMCSSATMASAGSHVLEALEI